MYLTFNTEIWPLQIGGNLSEEKRYFQLRFLKPSRRPYSNISWDIKKYSVFTKRNRRKKNTSFIYYMYHWSIHTIHDLFFFYLFLNPRDAGWEYKSRASMRHERFPRCLGLITKGTFISILEPKVLKSSNLSVWINSLQTLLF